MKRQILKDRYEELKKAVTDILECPRSLDGATIPKNFDEGNPDHIKQVICVMSVSLSRIYKLKKILEEK